MNSSIGILLFMAAASTHALSIAADSHENCKIKLNDITSISGENYEVITGYFPEGGNRIEARCDTNTSYSATEYGSAQENLMGRDLSKDFARKWFLYLRHWKTKRDKRE